jgi:uncharacterized membrane-anchored protein YjiN (DUF445 family)
VCSQPPLSAFALALLSSKYPRIAGVIHLIGEMAEPDHPLRLQFDEFVVEFVRRLKEDPQLRARIEIIKNELLAQPALAAYLQGPWTKLVG